MEEGEGCTCSLQVYPAETRWHGTRADVTVVCAHFTGLINDKVARCGRTHKSPPDHVTHPDVEHAGLELCALPHHFIWSWTCRRINRFRHRDWSTRHLRVAGTSHTHRHAHGWRHDPGLIFHHFKHATSSCVRVCLCACVCVRELRLTVSCRQARARRTAPRCWNASSSPSSARSTSSSCADWSLGGPSVISYWLCGLSVRASAE